MGRRGDNVCTPTDATATYGTNKKAAGAQTSAVRRPQPRPSNGMANRHPGADRYPPESCAGKTASHSARRA